MREVLGARLNRDGPARVIARLGPTSVADTGDAAGATRVWCYRVGPASRSAVVQFATDIEMAGKEFEADEIRVSRSNRVASTEGCALARRSSMPATPGGLRLGLSRSQVIRLLGAPIARGGDSLYYAWETTKALSPKEPSYSHWNARRKECFAGKAPFTNVQAEITLHMDSLGVYSFTLSRDANSIC